MEVNEKLIAVYTASTPGQADVARVELEEAGIQAVVMNESLHGVLGFASAAAHALPSVMVKESDLAAAQEIIANLTKDPGFLTWNRKDTKAGLSEDGESSSAGRVVAPWPHCPQCDKPRVTVCPICSTSGTNFPRADANFGAFEEESHEDAEPISDTTEQRLALICTTCDEPWHARFLRRCEWCGHDFGVGLRVDRVPKLREPVEPLNRRVLLMLALLVGVLAGIFVWIWKL